MEFSELLHNVMRGSIITLGLLITCYGVGLGILVAPLAIAELIVGHYNKEKERERLQKKFEDELVCATSWVRWEHGHRM